MNVIVKRLSIGIAVGILILTSCSKNNESLNSSETEIISSESLSEACVAEASEMSMVIFSNLFDSQLGSSTISIPSIVSSTDSLLAGASISGSGTGGMNNPQGTIIIDFKDTGTADPRGVVRKGKIIITYSGRRWAWGSTRSISFSGYSRNKVILADSTIYTITNSTADSSATRRNFQHSLEKCTLTFPDQRTFLREAEFGTRINFISKTTTVFSTNDTYATGRTRFGAPFTIKITDSLVYKPQCIGAKMYLPGKGKKDITAGASTYTVTYGSSPLTCAQTVNVTGSDKSGTITVNSDGN